MNTQNDRETSRNLMEMVSDSIWSVYDNLELGTKIGQKWPRMAKNSQKKKIPAESFHIIRHHITCDNLFLPILYNFRQYGVWVRAGMHNLWFALTKCYPWNAYVVLLRQKCREFWSKTTVFIKQMFLALLQQKCILLSRSPHKNPQKLTKSSLAAYQLTTTCVWRNPEIMLVIQVIQVMQVSQVIQVSPAQLWADFRVLFLKNIS